MTSFRTALVVFVASFAVQAAAQSAGEPCDPSADAPLCTADSSAELLCDASTSEWIEDSCESVGGNCDVVPCTGSDCIDIANCVAARGDGCIGLSPLFAQGGGRPLRVPCAPGSVCTLDAEAGTETCTAFPPGVSNCTVATVGARCEGDFIVACVPFGENSVVTSPGARDCGAEGLTCVQDGENIGCGERADDRCPAGGDGSACEGPLLNTCSAGVVVGTSDCASSGQACVEDGNEASCIVPDSRCGAAGLGVCAGTVATICQGGNFVTETDCTDLDRRCGPVPGQNGQIGCIVAGGGEGEGEGEGEDECSADSDCDDDEECDDGECRRVRPSRPGDEEEEPAGLFSCASSGATMPVGLALLALAIRRRR